MAEEIKEQPNWIEYGLQDLRRIEKKDTPPAPEEIKKADTLEDAITVLSRVFNLEDGKDSVTINTIVGNVVVKRSNLEHIVEKRNDARERYAHYALSTVTTPFEIWRIKYDNGDLRYAFIGLFDSKRQMLVVVSIWQEHILWNFMHCDKKNLNKHRHGELIYNSLNIQKAANQ